MVEQDKRWRYLKAGEVLFREGDAADNAYIIETGRVEVFREAGGRRNVMARLGAGDVVGEMAVVDRKPRTASVAAVDATRLLVLSPEHLHGKLAGTDPLVRLLLLVVLQRYRHVVHGREPEPADSEEDRRAAVAAIRVANELRNALTGNEFALHFQPVVDLDSFAVLGFEALLRWERKDHGLVPPAVFLPALEETGLIIDAGRWVLVSACQALARISRRHPKPDSLYMSINLSAQQLNSPRLVDDIVAAVREAGIEPGQLGVELTEGAFIANMDLAGPVIEKIREFGCKVSVDDFGTGYSSLNYLSRFSIDTVKFDRVFITALLKSAESTKVLAAIRDLARALRLNAVAEGVEDVEQARALRQIGIDAAQGFLFSRPVAEAAAAELLQQEWPWVFDRRGLERRNVERRTVEESEAP